MVSLGFGSVPLHKKPKLHKLHLPMNTKALLHHAPPRVAHGTNIHRLPGRGLPIRNLRAAAAVLGLIAALLTAWVPAAKAQSVTFSINPITLPDLSNPSFSDTITGTFVFSGTGVFTSANASSENVSYTLTMASSNPSVTPETASGGGALSGGGRPPTLPVSSARSR
jgi:hypothetical protein